MHRGDSGGRHLEQLGRVRPDHGSEDAHVFCEKRACQLRNHREAAPRVCDDLSCIAAGATGVEDIDQGVDIQAQAARDEKVLAATAFA